MTSNVRRGSRPINKFTSSILLMIALPLPCAAAPVEWDFVATGCAAGGGCISSQVYPVRLVTLTLPGLDSSGSASFDVRSERQPIYTGDSFTLDYSVNYQPLTSTFAGTPPGSAAECGPRGLCQFDLSWSEVAGQLTALHLYVNAFNDTFDTGWLLGGGITVASDNIYSGAGREFAGCDGPPCRLSGSWIDTPRPSNSSAVSEPGMLGAMLLSIAGIIGIRRRRPKSHFCLSGYLSKRLPFATAGDSSGTQTKFSETRYA